MYCRNCGKWLNGDDKFCSKCGTKAEEEFVPAFRENYAGEKEKPSKKFHIEEFKWDLEGYPTAKAARTEEVNFDWNSVMDEKQRNITEVDREENSKSKDDDISLEEKLFGADYVPVFMNEPTKVADPDKKIEETEKELEIADISKKVFADIPKDSQEESDRPLEMEKITEEKTERSDRIDRFYTFNKKQEEFQELLDREYERLRSGGVVLEPESEAIKPEVEKDPTETEASAEPEAEIISQEISEETVQRSIEPQVNEAKTMQFVGISLAETPKSVTAEDIEDLTDKKAFPSRVDIEDDIKGNQGKDEAAEKRQAEEDKEKITFDDIFNDDDDDDLYQAPKPRKKKKALKVIAIVLCILIIVELTLIGIQYFAPGTTLANEINRGFEYILSFFG